MCGSLSVPVNSTVSAIARIRPADSEAGGQALDHSRCCQNTGETVELSLQAQTLQQVSACQCAQPMVDQNRVESLREAIENGHYQIDSQPLASKILAFEQSL